MKENWTQTAEEPTRNWFSPLVEPSVEEATYARTPLLRRPAQERVIDEVSDQSQVHMLRVCTAGSVDDGKSTLIGRLLYDCRAIPEDQYEAIKRASGRAEEAINLALLTDGLRAEREQQITIDVAYRYFASPKRRFILADTPGHAQYTRNMATGASTADVAIVLVDARKGLLAQSRRHAMIAALLQVPKIVLAVNKMDLAEFSESVYRDIEAEFRNFAAGYRREDITAIPMSALLGDNVVSSGSHMPWYEGPALLEHLESIRIQGNDDAPFRFSVQCVIRPDQNFRGYAGQIGSGTIHVGDQVVALPSRISTTVKDVVTQDGPQAEARQGDSVVLVLSDELDISRGDLIVADQEPEEADRFEVELCWLGDQPYRSGRRYIALHGTAQTSIEFEEPFSAIDVETLETRSTDSLQRNDLATAIISSFRPIFLDSYRVSRETGALLIVDPETNVPAAAAMVSKVSPTPRGGRFDI